MKWQILTLAAPGVLVSSVLTGTFVRYGFQNYDWEWPVCLMLGAILSATDPVAVVALLKELGVSERLGTLIEGESLLNDGTAIVLFDVFKHAVEHAPCDPEMPGFVQVTRMLARLGGIGPIVGCFVGWISTRLLAHVLNDALNEITITLLACFASFGVAEGVVGTSGVLSTVFCGMYLSRYGRGCISATVEDTLHAFWGQLAHIANTAVFFLAGLIVAVKVLDTRRRNLGDDCVECPSHEHDGYDEGHRRRLSHEADVDTDCTSFRWLDAIYLVELYFALHFVRAAVARSALFLFSECARSMLRRSSASRLRCSGAASTG